MSRPFSPARITGKMSEMSPLARRTAKNTMPWAPER